MASPSISPVGHPRPASFFVRVCCSGEVGWMLPLILVVEPSTNSVRRTYVHVNLYLKVMVWLGGAGDRAPASHDAIVITRVAFGLARGTACPCCHVQLRVCNERDPGHVCCSAGLEIVRPAQPSISTRRRQPEVWRITPRPFRHFGGRGPRLLTVPHPRSRRSAARRARRSYGHAVS